MGFYSEKIFPYLLDWSLSEKKLINDKYSLKRDE